jgi:hypothetical protein
MKMKSQVPDGGRRGGGECNWTKFLVILRNFLFNHSRRNHMFTQHAKLKMLANSDTRFASAIVMLRRFQTIRQGDSLASKKVCLFIFNCFG